MTPEEIFDLPVHPAAEIFPLLDAKAAAELALDIQRQGLIDPLVIWDGFLLDGRNRRAACKEASVDPRVEEFTGEDPVDFIISKNIHRRHLKLGERALLAAELARLGRGRPPARPEAAEQGALFDGGAEKPQICGITATDAADRLGVSARSVESARAVLDHGTPALREAVKSGALPVSTGEKVARLPVEEQDALVSAGDARIRDRARSLVTGAAKPPAQKPAAKRVFDAAEILAGLVATAGGALKVRASACTQGASRLSIAYVSGGSDPYYAVTLLNAPGVTKQELWARLVSLNNLYYDDDRSAERGGALFGVTSASSVKDIKREISNLEDEIRASGGAILD